MVQQLEGRPVFLMWSFDASSGNIVDAIIAGFQVWGGCKLKWKTIGTGAASSESGQKLTCKELLQARYKYLRPWDINSMGLPPQLDLHAGKACSLF